MKIRTLLLFSAMLVSTILDHTKANAACADLAGITQRNLIFDKAAQEKVRQNMLAGCDPVFPPKRGGLSGESTPENTMEDRIKTPANRPSLKYQDVAKSLDPSNPNCNANLFGAPGGKSGDGTTNNCNGGSVAIPPIPPIVPPDLSDPEKPTKSELRCYARIGATFHTRENVNSLFAQLCAYAGVKICDYTFMESGCIGDQDGDGGPAPPAGFFTYTGQFAVLGLNEDYLRGPFYLHNGGTLTLPDGTTITIAPERFVWLDTEDGTIRVYDSAPITEYEYHFPPDSEEEVELRGADTVIYVALCSLDDTCYPSG